MGKYHVIVIGSQRYDSYHRIVTITTYDKVVI